MLTFQANNITQHSKRAIASATCLIGGGLGGIIAGVAFISSERPTYRVSDTRVLPRIVSATNILLDGNLHHSRVFDYQYYLDRNLGHTYVEVQ